MLLPIAQTMWGVSCGRPNCFRHVPSTLREGYRWKTCERLRIAQDLLTRAIQDHHSDSVVESHEALVRTIDEASRYVPVENLAISPQCGFASTAPGNLLSWDDQRRKLELVAQLARRVWG